MESSTQVLRRMLDERGVEWEDASPVPSMKPWKTSFTSFTGEEVTIGAYEEPKWLMGTMVFLTPEQAIEATVGRGTCKQEEHGWSTEGDHARVWLTCGHDCMVETVADLPNFCPICGRKVVTS